MLVRWHVDGPTSAVFQEHVSRIADYLWSVRTRLRSCRFTLGVLNQLESVCVFQDRIGRHENAGELNSGSGVVCWHVVV